MRDGAEPPRALEVVIANTSSQPVCIARDKANGGVVGLQTAFVGSFGPLGDAVRRDGSGKPRYQLQLLMPGQQETLQVDLAGRGLPWVDDSYTLVLRYGPGATVLRALTEQAMQQGCALVPGPVLAPQIDFKVSGVAGSATLGEYSARWRSDPSDDERWKALRWLGRNAVSPGMSKSEVVSILGDPTRAKDGSHWVYSIGSVGLTVRFVGERVAHVEFFET